MIKLYKHNKESYEKIKSMFETKNKVAVVQPTGTGKSFLILKWIEDNRNNNIVVLSSSNAILTQLYNYAEKFNCLDIFKNVEVFTYTKFLYMTSKEIKRLKADKIIIDEFHRTGATSWYKKVNLLLNTHKNAKVLGLTATPIRYLDGARNMIEELLDGNVANEITLGEAVYKGILPKFKYITASYSHDDTKYILKKIKSIKDSSKRIKMLTQYKEMINNIDQANKIEDLFRDNIKNKSGSFIVFCKSIAHTKECEKKLTKWFNNINIDVNIYISTSDDYNKDIQLENFINDKSDRMKLLLSVNRFNEGLHVEGITGVIMMRPTLSPITYLQQLGRALSFSQKDNIPIVFDLVNNYNYIIPFMNRISNSTGNPFTDQYIEAMKKDKSYEPNIRIKFDIFQNAIKYNDLISEIESRLYIEYNTWDDNYELLKEFIDKFDRLPSQSETYNNINLRTWINNQRTKNSNGVLSKERKEKLESLKINIFEGFDGRWDRKYELLKEFIDKFDRLPKVNDIYKDIKIGQWLKTQKIKNRQGLLSNYRKEKLESLDSNIFENINDIWNNTWDDNYEVLKEFIDKFDRLPTQKEVYKDIKIGSWIDYQKHNNKQGKLSDDRKEKLESLDSNIFENINDIWNNTWDDNYEVLKEFIDKFNRLPKVNDIYKDIKIGKWLNAQKIKNRQGLLSNYRKEKLESLDSNIFEKSRNTWDDNYEVLKEFISKFNRLPTQKEVYKNIKIGRWLYDQKYRKYRKYKDNYKLQKLESLGIKFD